MAAPPTHHIAEQISKLSLSGKEQNRDTSRKSTPSIDHLAAVLFLDVDGVLHPPNPKQERLQFRRSCMELLSQVVAESGATIVLSTTWRLHVGARQHLAARLAEYGLSFVSRTPSIAQFQRPKEILSWVRKHKPVTWVAVDDWPLHEGGDPLAGHFVQTKARFGLQQDTADKIKFLYFQQREAIGTGQVTDHARGGLVSLFATALPDGI
eukprot:CAMPEP_0183339096 /NCGR_PEP_ID=MMETSP0164_2-20130417/6151_1 /TAXON_ID=221442 /ORGANISM="Coccolithus pelagicus ssp braarudi, Strain PLY182g" /LENGTH=208 /DNA_ID=CAMNT_0025509051 /DNA_START=36 /DNA_END=662 /DNA_ORIENTATION=+